MLTVQINANQLRVIARNIPELHPTLRQALPGIMNTAGMRMTGVAQSRITRQLNIPYRMVDVETTLASQVHPQFTLTMNRGEYVRWITEADELVCKICGPHHGVIYHEDDASQIWPAHPNCRCRIDMLDPVPPLMEMADGLISDALTEIGAGFMDTFARAWRNMGGGAP